MLDIVFWREIAHTDEAAIEWCMAKGLLKDKMSCHKCGKDMELKSYINVDHMMWRCSCSSKKSIRAGSFFSGSKLTIVNILSILRHWCTGISQVKMTVYVDVSEKSLVDWCSFIREICEKKLLANEETLIGGPGFTIEVDESLVAKRKYNRGRLVKQVWVFGGVLRKTAGEQKRVSFCEIVPFRTKAILQDVITRRVATGTRIISDGWKGYEGLSDKGYIHDVINHSENFVSPTDRSIHTQNVENEWNWVKKFLRSKGTNRVHLEEHLLEYTYKKRYPNTFQSICHHLKEIHALNDRVFYPTFDQ